MGTNFYWVTKKAFDTDDPEYHIGKRSAAGMYCWDCRRTLCKNGDDAIHAGHWLDHARNWYKACPVCGKEPEPETLDSNPAGVELGFAKPRQAKPTGVRGCSSFSWAQHPSKVRQRCQRNKGRKVVMDEYGDKYTGQEFLDMLDSNCPVEYTNSIGVWFC